MAFPTTGLPDHAEEFYTKWYSATFLVLLMESAHIFKCPADAGSVYCDCKQYHFMAF
jgi:hypothetical protein